MFSFPQTLRTQVGTARWNPGCLLLRWLDEDSFCKEINWTKADELIPIAEAMEGMTIWVNGVALSDVKDDSEHHFGRLFTGDLLEFSVDSDSPIGSFIFCRVRCNFYYGLGSQPRKKDFVVEKFHHHRRTGTFFAVSV